MTAKSRPHYAFDVVVTRREATDFSRRAIVATNRFLSYSYVVGAGIFFGAIAALDASKSDTPHAILEAVIAAGAIGLALRSFFGASLAYVRGLEAIQPVSYAFDDDGIGVTSAGGTRKSFIGWPAVTGFYRLPSAVVIVAGKQSWLMIPMRCTPLGEERAFEAFLLAHTARLTRIPNA